MNRRRQVVWNDHLEHWYTHSPCDVEGIEVGLRVRLYWIMENGAKVVPTGDQGRVELCKREATCEPGEVSRGRP